MKNTVCNQFNCINWKKNGRCALSNPELGKDYCLHFEDNIDSLRLKADAIKGILNNQEINPYKVSQLIDKQKKKTNYNK